MAEGVCSAEIRHKLAAVFKDDRVSRSRHVYLSGADGQTDRCSSERPRCIQCSAVKTKERSLEFTVNKVLMKVFRTTSMHGHAYGMSTLVRHSESKSIDC